MQKAAIIIDDWKLDIFKDYLDREGFNYTQFSGPWAGGITLEVEMENVNELKAVVEAANIEATLYKNRN